MWGNAYSAFKPHNYQKQNLLFDLFRQKHRCRLRQLSLNFPDIIRRFRTAQRHRTNGISLTDNRRQRLCLILHIIIKCQLLTFFFLCTCHLTPTRFNKLFQFTTDRLPVIILFSISGCCNDMIPGPSRKPDFLTLLPVPVHIALQTYSDPR